VNDNTENAIRDILEEIAGLGVLSPTIEISGGLVAKARCVLDQIGPRVRSAQSVQHHDDYIVVRQVAVAIDAQGRMHTRERMEGEEQYLIPVLAGTAHCQRKSEAKTAARIGLSVDDMRKAVQTIADGIDADDYREAWDRYKSKQAPDSLVLGPSPDE